MSKNMLQVERIIIKIGAVSRNFENIYKVVGKFCTSNNFSLCWMKLTQRLILLLTSDAFTQNILARENLKNGTLYNSINHIRPFIF